MSKTKKNPNRYESTVSVCAHNIAFHYDLDGIRFYVKKGTWPVMVAGDNTTYYVIDRENPLEDGKNPLYFAKQEKADAAASKLNAKNPLTLTDELRERLDEEAEDRAKTCLNDGCHSGELNYLYVFDEGPEEEIRGWWEIDN